MYVGLTHAARIAAADAFAETAHTGQFRKYLVGVPYIVHPRAVAAIVASVPHDVEQVQAALLHDTIEDCGVTREQIEVNFGAEVARLVWALTDQAPRTMNRKARKAWERDRLAQEDARVQTVKIADLTDNLPSIVAGDRGFGRIFLEEARTLLDALLLADTTLRLRLEGLLNAGIRGDASISRT